MDNFIRSFKKARLSRNTATINDKEAVIKICSVRFYRELGPNSYLTDQGRLPVGVKKLLFNRQTRPLWKVENLVLKRHLLKVEHFGVGVISLTPLPFWKTWALNIEWCTVCWGESAKRARSWPSKILDGSSLALQTLNMQSKTIWKQVPTSAAFIPH